VSVRRILLVAGREAGAERGQPDGLVAGVTFMAVLVLLESLVVGPLVARQPVIAAALYWIALAFAAILATSRSFDRELEDDALDALLALPGGRDALYGGKVLSQVGAVAIVGLLGGVLSIGLLGLEVALGGHLVLVAVVGMIALPPVIVLDVLLALRLRSRAALVPILALPVLVPQLVAATQGTAAALSGDGAGALGWGGLLLAFGIVYTVLGVALAPGVVE
jgi:heme exporter protein B